MFHLLGWLIYGLIVGIIAKAIHSGRDPRGFWATLAIGVVGSYVGGFIKYLLGWGEGSFEPAGFLMGIVGGVIFCWVYGRYMVSHATHPPLTDERYPR